MRDHHYGRMFFKSAKNVELLGLYPIRNDRFARHHVAEPFHVNLWDMSNQLFSFSK